MYFDTEIQTRRTQPPRNDDGGDSNVSNRLSIFKCPRRAFKYSSTRTREDRELVAAEIYIFMNCAELDPYIEEFDSVILQRNPRLTDVQIEKEWEKSFATWLRNQVEQGFITDSRVQEIRDMVRGGRSGRVSNSVGRGSTRIGSASPFTPVVPATGSASRSTPVVPATGSASPSTLVVPATGFASCPVASPFPSQSPTEVESHHPAADEEGPQRPGRQPCWISGGGTCSRDRRISLEHKSSESLLPRLISEKSMWEARDQATKTTGSRDPTAWMDYSPVWLRRDY
ncbi:hypothetical protein Taro_029326 [Colocasia esculenta]|uniref:Uncharacterized protein n=1 Tax=Colocasia esculenta TaxID=4460 RepID=A0A843VJJ8_COLES|nr:hypothetical protein [Colocasia esculenta]